MSLPTNESSNDGEPVNGDALSTDEGTTKESTSLAKAAKSDLASEPEIEPESDGNADLPVMQTEPIAEPVAEPEPIPLVPVSSGPVRIPTNLPNASAGKVYEVDLCQYLFGEFRDGIKWFHLDLPGGLSFDPETGLVTGPATEPGEFDLKLKYLLKDHPVMTAAYETTIHLIVNPDPRSLWTSKPSDPRGHYAKDDRVFLPERTQSCHVIAASTRGRSHAQVGSYRDDHFTIETVAPNTPQEWICFAVADGAGSAEYSRQGSKVACEVSVRDLSQRLEGEQGGTLRKLVQEWDEASGDENASRVRMALYEILVHSAHSAFRRLNEEVDPLPDHNLKDFHSTILLTILHKLPSGNWFCASFSIGDGGVAIYRRSDEAPSEVIPLNSQDGGEFAGQTLFFTMNEVWKDSQSLMDRIFCKITPNFTALVSMTDGITDPFFETSKNFESVERWDTFWKILTEPSEYTDDSVNLDPTNQGMAQELSQWLDFFSKGNHDDRTIVVVLPLSGNPSPPPSLANNDEYDPGQSH